MALIKFSKLPMLFKGAGPGTHWNRNDARLSGFAPSQNISIGLNQIVGHINLGSQGSPLISFTTSYALACEYAAIGPAGPASPTDPGHVYCVDLSQLPEGPNPIVVDPISELASHRNGGFIHGHNGNSTLMTLLASNSAVPPPHQRQRFGVNSPATVTAAFLALVRASRDAEVLVYGTIPKGAVVARDNIF